MSQDQWLEAREELLIKEKELSRRRDTLNVEWRRMPMVEVSKICTSDGPDGPVTLGGLFGDSMQAAISTTTSRSPVGRAADPQLPARAGPA